MAKREKINQLKAKVTAMQHDLSMLQRKRHCKIVDTPQFLKPINRISNNKPKKLLGQTYRQNSFKESDYYFGRQQSLGRKERMDLRMQTEKRLSPVLREITQSINNSFYMHSIDEREQSKQKIQEPEVKINRRKNSCNSPLHRGSIGPDMVGYTSCTIKEGKKRMYETKKTDLILNPESKEEKGMRIVKKIEKSPDKYFSEHPKSNPNIYIFSQKKTIMPVKRHVGDRNRSHLVNSKSKGQIMPAKDASSLQKTMKGKRHFNRYINEIYSSRFTPDLERPLR